MSEKENDIVADILGRAERAVRNFVSQPEFKQLLAEIAHSGGGLEQRVADSLAQQIRGQDTPARQHWSGNNPYVAERPRPDSATKRRALEEVSKTGNVAAAVDSTGLSRATIYRLIGEHRRQR